MIMVSDNYDAFVAYEREQERITRRRNRQAYEYELEEMQWNEVPQDYGTHKDCYPCKED